MPSAPASSAAPIARSRAWRTRTRLAAPLLGAGCDRQCLDVGAREGAVLQVDPHEVERSCALSSARATSGSVRTVPTQWLPGAQAASKLAFHPSDPITDSPTWSRTHHGPLPEQANRRAYGVEAGAGALPLYSRR